jgi:hypothetical protein
VPRNQPGGNEKSLEHPTAAPTNTPDPSSKGSLKLGAGPSHLREVFVQLGISLEPQVSEALRFTTRQQLVEDVEIPLPLVLIDDSGLFYQVTDDMPAYGNTLQNRIKIGQGHNNQATLFLVSSDEQKLLI